MAKGKRKFVLEITETEGLTLGELANSLSRVAAGLQTGHQSLEEGNVHDTTRKAIGRYKWVRQLAVGPDGKPL